jgi:adenosylcobinamide-GDP ribazoletransferase
VTAGDIVADLRAALLLLTRLPVGSQRAGAPEVARSVWAYPIVGALVGAIGGGAYWVAISLGLSSTIGGLLALLAMAFTTGGFHEDGLADTADGFGGGATKARKLEIMRDSRVGTYGALAIVFSIALRTGALAETGAVEMVFLALVTAGAASRATTALLLLSLAPANPDGLGAGAKDPPPAACWLAIAFGAMAAVVWGPAIFLTLILVLTIGALVTRQLSKMQIGGYTGDVLGANQQVTEILFLLTIAAMA